MQKIIVNGQISIKRLTAQIRTSCCLLKKTNKLSLRNLKHNAKIVFKPITTLINV